MKSQHLLRIYIELKNWYHNNNSQKGEKKMKSQHLQRKYIHMMKLYYFCGYFKFIYKMMVFFFYIWFLKMLCIRKWNFRVNYRNMKIEQKLPLTILCDSVQLFRKNKNRHWHFLDLCRKKQKSLMALFTNLQY